MANKIQLRRIARIHAASMIRNTECTWAFADSGLSNEDIAYLDNQMQTLSDKMLKTDPPFANADQIVLFVLNEK